jgi:surfeit locus 1 family protein
MLPTGYRFRPAWWGVLLAAAGCAAGIALGHWQWGRAVEKRAAAAVERVQARGVFLSEHTVYLDNKLRHQRAGYEVVTPLRTADGTVLVNRGWIAAGPSRDVLPAVHTPPGEVRIEGIERRRMPHVLQVGKPKGGKVRQNLDIDTFSSETGLRLQRRVIEQHSPLGDGLARDWPAPDSGAAKHEAYALQWYTLAALCVVLLVALGFRREKPSS